MTTKSSPPDFDVADGNDCAGAIVAFRDEIETRKLAVPSNAHVQPAILLSRTRFVISSNLLDRAIAVPIVSIGGANRLM